MLSRVIATDDELIVFGTDAQERWVGSSAFLSAEEQMMQAFDVESLDRREETLQIHSRGGVAWFSTVFDIEISLDGELASLESFRLIRRYLFPASKSSIDPAASGRKATLLKQPKIGRF